MKKKNQIIKEQIKKEIKGHQKESPTAGYIATIIVHGLLIYFVSKLPNWVSFLGNGWYGITWLLYISFAANIVANVLYLIYDEKPFKNLIQLALNIFSLIILYNAYLIFPFNVSNDSASLIRFFLILAIFGTAIGVIVEFVQLIKNSTCRK